jgi:excisionase family DNA binding protein
MDLKTIVATTVALMDYETAQRYLGGVSRSTMKQLVADRDIRKLKVRRRTLFRKDDLDAYIARRTPSGDVA